MHATTAKGRSNGGEQRHADTWEVGAIIARPSGVCPRLCCMCSLEMHYRRAGDMQEQVHHSSSNTWGVHSGSHCSGSHLVRDTSLSSFALASSFVEQVQL